MSDAMLKGTVRNKTLQGNRWGGVNLPIASNTVITGYADGSGAIRFRLPLGSWAFGLSKIYTMTSNLKLRYCLLDSSAQAEELTIGQSSARDRLMVNTDEWGNAYLEIKADADPGVVGGAIGMLVTPSGDAGYMYVSRGHPNQPWNSEPMPQHKAAVYPICPNDIYWVASQYYSYRIYRGTMCEPTALVDGAYPHYPHPELVPFVDDGSYAWLSVPNSCGASLCCPDVDNGESVMIHAATHEYQRTIGSASRSSTIQHIGDSIRQKKGSAPCMGLAHLPVRVKQYSPGVADPPFNDTFSSYENIPADESKPWFLPAYITVETNAYAHIRIPFQNIPHTMAWKTDSQWGWTTGVHQNTALTALPELLLMNDGSGTNLLSGITLEGTGGSGGTIAQDPGGITIRARLSSVPSIGEHACFVKCQGAYIRVSSPAANGNGESPAQEEWFTPYPS